MLATRQSPVSLHPSYSSDISMMRYVDIPVGILTVKLCFAFTDHATRYKSGCVICLSALAAS